LAQNINAKAEGIEGKPAFREAPFGHYVMHRTKLARGSRRMSQKSQTDQHKSAAVEPVVAGERAADLAWQSPIVMITSSSSSVYVTDKNRTKWEEHPPLPDKKSA
jgi:hypothetical protein